MLKTNPVFIVLSLVTALSGVCLAADDLPCTAHDGDNFRPTIFLARESSADTVQGLSTDYEFKSPGGHDFFINVCKPVVYETWHVEVDHPETIAGITRKERGDFSIGEVNTTLLIRDKHPLLILTEGSMCPHSEHIRAMTAVRFICDTSVFGSGSPQLVAQLPPEDSEACAFFLEWRTHYACPSGKATGFWAGLFIVLSIFALVALTLYIVGGTLYNRYVLQKQGFDQLPRISIFSFADTLEYIQNLCDRILPSRERSWQDESRGRSLRNRGSQRGFERLPTLPEEAHAILGDDDSEEDHSTEHVRAMGDDRANEGQREGMDAHGVIRL
ncbi:hypothetical protein OF83DRAFT_1167059 [Amylostereum chailletii]|nr:hypothetical protein OF83DRAFT_1167059 [Amylostereum chailletii]